MSTVATTHPASSPPHSRRMLFLRMLVGLVLLLLVVRLLLPWLLERAVNRRLGALPAHQGVVGDIDLQLFRGAYRLHDLSIRHRGPDGEPLISVRTVDFSLAWRELFRGRIVSDITLDAPILRLARTAPAVGPEGVPPPSTGEEDWRDLVRDLFPFEITRLVVREGSFDYADPTRDPPVSIGLDHLGARVEGLANHVPAGGETHPAQAELSAAVVGGGALSVEARGSPLADPPEFEAEAELDDVHLPALNTFLRSALGVDVSAGQLHVAAEFRAAGGRYEGYVKPLVRGARFADVGTEPAGGGPLKVIKEGIAAGATALLTNDSTDNVGTRVPFSGEFGAGEVGTWDAFLTLLRNAFIRALREGVDQSVTGGAGA